MDTPEIETTDCATLDRLYQVARVDALRDPGYLLEMIEAMNKQREHRRVVDDDQYN